MISQCICEPCRAFNIPRGGWKNIINLSFAISISAVGAGWKNPNASASKSSTKKFHLTLNHTALESSVSKKAPFAPRSFLGQSSYDTPKVVNGKPFSMQEYNPLEDPHLGDYYARKLGLKSSLSDSPKKVNITPNNSKKILAKTYLIRIII